MADVKGTLNGRALYEVVITKSEWLKLQDGQLDCFWLEMSRTLDVLGEILSVKIYTTRPDFFEDGKLVEIKFFDGLG